MPAHGEPNAALNARSCGSALIGVTPSMVWTDARIVHPKRPDPLADLVASLDPRLPRWVGRIIVSFAAAFRIMEQRPRTLGLGEGDEALVDEVLVKRNHSGNVSLHRPCLGGDVDSPEAVLVLPDVFGA